MPPTQPALNSDRHATAIPGELEFTRLCLRGTRQSGRDQRALVHRHANLTAQKLKQYHYTLAIGHLLKQP